MAETHAPATVPFEERLPRPPMVLNNRSMSWITNLIAGIPEQKTPLWWYITIAITASLAPFGFFFFFPVVFLSRWLGKQYSGRLGLGYHQLRVLDRYRSRWNAYFGYPIPLPPEAAHI